MLSVKRCCITENDFRSQRLKATNKLTLEISSDRPLLVLYRLDYYAAVLIGRITEVARPFVCQSVHLSLYGPLTRKQNGTETPKLEQK